MTLKKMVDGVLLDCTPEEEAEYLARVAAEEVLREQRAYITARLTGDPCYGSIESQLDLMYHQGFEGWRDFIKSVKDAHPKPEETS